MPRFLKIFLKKFFPRLYYSEKIHRIIFEISKPSPIKIVIFLIIISIIVLIFNSFSTDDPGFRLYSETWKPDSILK